MDVTSKTFVLHQQETPKSGNIIYFKSDRKIVCFNVQHEIYVTENVTEYWNWCTFLTDVTQKTVCKFRWKCLTGLGNENLDVQRWKQGILNETYSAIPAQAKGTITCWLLFQCKPVAQYYVCCYSGTSLSSNNVFAAIPLQAWGKHNVCCYSWTGPRYDNMFATTLVQASGTIPCLMLFYYKTVVHLDTGFSAISTQVFLGFPVPRSKCWDGSQDSKLPLHASHVALPT